MEASALREGGAAEIDRALVRFPLEPMDPLERPYVELAGAYALVGEPSRAVELLEEFERSTPEPFQRGLRFERHRVRGEVASLDGRHEDAIAELRQSYANPQDIGPTIGMAQAFDRAGQADSARVYYGRYLESRHWLGVMSHSVSLANALGRAAELEYEAGNLDRAAAYLAEFVELWKDADPELQPRVEAARFRLEQILREQG
jgi:tetratricopeptide (TPR) repeat protein